MTRDKVRKLIAEQEQWIAEHGENLLGYVERYGSKDDPEHFGDGGEAIYRADANALAELRRLLPQARS